MADVASVERWQPTTKKWRRCTPSPRPLLGTQYVMLDSGDIMASGGLQTTTSGESFIWTPQHDAWRSAGCLEKSRYLHGMCALLDGSVLAVGGLHLSADNQQLSALASVEHWCPQSEAWTQVSALPNATAEPAIIAMQNGGALVIGGYDEEFQRECWLYDAVTNSFTATDQLAVGRAGHTATLLPNGNVLVVGGCNSFEFGDTASEVEEAELWAPATGQWTTIDGPAITRHGHTATALPDGRVVIVGGWHGDNPIGTAEVWSPS